MLISSVHRKIWIVLIVLAGLWITLNLFCVFFYKSSHAFSIINRFALPGPFFSQNRITIVPHWWIRFRVNGRWGAWRNPESENFHKYHNKPIEYHYITKANLDRSLGINLSRKVYTAGLEDVFTHEEFKTFSHYVLSEYGTSGADSIHLVYVIDRFEPKTQTMHRDTSFVIAYQVPIK